MDRREQELIDKYGITFVEVIKRHVWKWESGRDLDLSKDCFWSGDISTPENKKLWGYTDGKSGASVHDSGGETKGGFAQNAHPSLKVRELTIDQVFKLYYEQYALPVGYEKLPDSVAIVLFDIGCGSGPRVAIKMLQKCVNTTVDGALGPQTIGAAKTLKKEALFDKLTEARKQFYKDIVSNKPSQSIYLNGWLNRANALEGIVKGLGV